MAASTITRVRGDDWSIPGAIADGGTAVNLTGATVTSKLRRNYASTAATSFTVTVTNAAAGELTLSLADTATVDLEPGSYVYDVQVVAGSTTTTYGAGSVLVVAADVTR